MTGFRTMLLVSLIAHSLLLLLPSEDPQVEQVVYASENSLVMMIRHPSPAAAPEVVPGEKKTRLEPELQSPPPKKQQPSEKRVLPKPTTAQLNRKSTPSTENTLAAQVPKKRASAWKSRTLLDSHPDHGPKPSALKSHSSRHRKHQLPGWMQTEVVHDTRKDLRLSKAFSQAPLFGMFRLEARKVLISRNGFSPVIPLRPKGGDWKVQCCSGCPSMP